ncbi:L-lactate permease [Reyranella sp. CPCC 100927]|uniref:L-lactate permease n=1 Tax=Reyranella sp. CPCC 100927 TaxID=2599616 RepID=UPI0011B679EB|nr:L-lactate permease [Reyranella sp. CPCC 100927]TWT14972.1 L-lactate permease [Reyranella sp. CPCC 100927]
MPVLLAVAPLLLVMALLASGRVSALPAGAAGLAATLLVVLIAPPENTALLPFLAYNTFVGAWLAWQVIAIVLGGIFFYLCVRARDLAGQPASPALPVADDLHPRLYFVCFLLGPFAEAVTGFGVGYVITLATVVRLGVRGVPALVLGLYSQSLVPWGALAAGTTLGAQIAGMEPTVLGARSAVLQMPMHAAYLALFWHFLRASGVPLRVARCLEDVAWTVVTVAAVWLAHAVIDVEIAGAAPLGALVALRWVRNERPDLMALRRALRTSLPYVALTLALVATRTVPPLQAVLKSLAAWQPLPDQPPFAPFYVPGFWLLVIGAGTLVAARAPAWRVVRDTVASGWRPSVVTLFFVVMAAFYVAAGMAASIADALHAAMGVASALGAPLFAAIGGFLTGSGSASNAMLMPMQIAVAAEAHVDPSWMAAVQNAVTTNLTMLSPIRVSMGVAILALARGDSAVYRAAWPLALPPIVAGMGTIGWLLAVG